ncbi:hypothetical protein H5410_052273 [Solanum commersonii]|uniref:Uncharacterized protein n=1 Tax=Solanum commersonii TaxID=4109 RepID=A0A9J5X352_SOLCO|nr:hypothetical protein H5410_052273 [Solanum commersonii]
MDLKCTNTTPSASVKVEPTDSRNERGKLNVIFELFLNEEEDEKNIFNDTYCISSTVPTDLPTSSSSPPNYHALSSVNGTTKKERGRENTSPDKRPRVLSMGVFEAANSFKVMNPDIPSSKIYSTAISTRKLQEIREKQRKKMMESSSNNPSHNSTSSQCEIYFNTEVKCDSIDNNVSEYFNTWILTAGHKTIITMLEKKK